MEELREGIYLRGYGQQDPLIAYKNEARTFFDEMTRRIANDVAQTILRVSVKTAEQAEQEEKGAPGSSHQPPPPGAAPHDHGNRSTGTSWNDPPSPRPPAPPDRPANEKLGRNDPCWCGSGKKYKKCHGR
jgi:preprotein translocase subunit SecA